MRPSSRSRRTSTRSIRSSSRSIRTPRLAILASRSANFPSSLVSRSAIFPSSLVSSCPSRQAARNALDPPELPNHQPRQADEGEENRARRGDDFVSHRIVLVANAGQTIVQIPTPKYASYFLGFFGTISYAPILRPDTAIDSHRLTKATPPRRSHTPAKPTDARAASAAPPTALPNPAHRRAGRPLRRGPPKRDARESGACGR